MSFLGGIVKAIGGAVKSVGKVALPALGAVGGFIPGVGPLIQKGAQYAQGMMSGSKGQRGAPAPGLPPTGGLVNPFFPNFSGYNSQPQTSSGGGSKNLLWIVAAGVLVLFFVGGR